VTTVPEPGLGIRHFVGCVLARQVGDGGCPGRDGGVGEGFAQLTVAGRDEGRDMAAHSHN